MARYTGPRNRIARRFGTNIFGRARNPLLHKPNRPGMHGAKRRKKSDFGLQVEEQQKLRAVYGMVTLKQLVRYFRAASHHSNMNEFFIQQLECRLDTVVHRLKFASTPFAAHQLVSHGHVLVNGKKVDRRSFQVQPGMVITLKPKALGSGPVKQAQENAVRQVPDYLAWDAAKGEGSLLHLPATDQIPLPLPVNLPLICEYLAYAT